MLKQKTLISIIFNVSSSLIGLVSVFFVAQYMGPKALGVINSSVAFASLFVIIGDLGFGLAHQKRVSEGMDLGVCIGTFKRIKLVLTLLMAIAVIGSFLLIKAITGIYPIEEEYLGIFAIILVSSLITNYYNYIPNTFGAKIEKTKEGIIFLSNKFLVGLFRSITAAIGLGIIYLAWGTLLGAIISSIIAILLFKKYPVKKFDRGIYKSYQKYAFPSLAVLIISVVLVQLDKIFLAYFANTTEVGYYTGAQGFVMILTFVSSIFISLLMPTYSSLFAENRINEVRSLASRVERYISILIMPVGVFIILFSNEIRLLLLGPQFEPSSIILSVLAIGAMFTIFSQPYSSQLLGAGLMKTSVRIGLWVLIIDILLNIVLIPESLFGIKLFGLGGLGAAISMTIATLFGALLGRFYAFKTTNSTPNYKILVHLIAALIPFMLLKYFDLNKQLDFNIIIYLFLIVILGEILYLAILWIMKELNKEDIRYYLSIMSLSLMRKYLKSEFNESNDKSVK